MPIVIVGAGPVGLYTAISMARNGYLVHVVDKYADNFTRPGVVAIQAGETITRQLKEIGISIVLPLAGSFPETYYISDIQKTLYSVAEKLGVKFTAAHFKSIKGDSIELEGSDVFIPCDMLIDCTGESRKVVDYINSNYSPSLFKISKIAENPVKTNFIAYITMSNDDAELLSDYRGSASPVNEVLQFESLRAQGWTYNDMPHWDMRRWEYSKTEKRFCCYFEMPEDLARAPQLLQKKWLETMLELKAGKKIDFAIEGGSSLKFCPFSVDPHKVENPILETDVYPFPIVVCGDALMSAEYRKGTGIFNGIVCANGLVNATRIHQEKFYVDIEAFNRTMTEHLPARKCIEDHIKSIKDTYQARKNNSSDIKIQKDKLAHYSNALSSCPEDETIKKGLFYQIVIFKKLVDDLLINRKYAKACDAYQEVLSTCRILEENPSVELTELAKLYDLKARICSNLERAHRGNKDLPKAAEYLAEGIQNCKDAIIRIGDTDNETLLNYKKEFLEFQTKLEGRQNPSIIKVTEVPTNSI